MDIASLAGIILGAVMFVFGVFSNGGFEALKNMVDSASIIITVGGSISGVLAAHKLPDFINGLKGITLTFKEKAEDPAETIKKIIDLSNVARKEGLLALEEAANDIEDDFMKKGVMLVVDGTDPELVRGIMETSLSCMEERHKKVIAFWEKWAELGPAWGMIGTLIGLVNMLRNLEDASTIGPAMAVSFESLNQLFELDLIYPGDRSHLEEKVKKCIDDSGTLTCQFRIKRNGAFSWVRMSMITFLGSNGVCRCHVLFSDISSEKDREEQITDALNKLRYVTRHDKLTQIYNRETFCASTDKLLSVNPSVKYSIIMWDIKNFKVIIAKSTEDYLEYTLDELLPLAFTGKNLD